ncbi:MAG: PP2C family protein-serine/threonine phosphatase, partial [Gammaproteobacteria bacterium]
DAGELLARVNEELCETSTMGMFVTIIAGYLDPGDDHAEIANGGHQPALIRRGPGNYSEVAAAAPPLGVLGGITFPVTRIPLDGASSYLYTEGLSQSATGDGTALDTAGVIEMIESAGTLPPMARLPGIIAAWRRGGYTTHDDITLMLVELVR